MRDDVWVSVSVTTRAPRPGEVQGVHYWFISAEEFDGLLGDGGLLEWAEVHGNRYGTPRAAVEEAIEQGRQVVLEIDPQGAFQVKKLIERSVLIFIMPPSPEELARRLQQRGSETEEQMQERLRNAAGEIELVGDYDHVVINDDVSRASSELASIIGSYANDEES